MSKEIEDKIQHKLKWLGDDYNLEVDFAKLCELLSSYEKRLGRLESVIHVHEADLPQQVFTNKGHSPFTDGNYNPNADSTPQKEQTKDEHATQPWKEQLEGCRVPCNKHVWDSRELNPHCHCCGILMRDDDKPEQPKETDENKYKFNTPPTAVPYEESEDLDEIDRKVLFEAGNEPKETDWEIKLIEFLRNGIGSESSAVNFIGNLLKEKESSIREELAKEIDLQSDDFFTAPQVSVLLKKKEKEIREEIGREFKEWYDWEKTL